MTGVIELKAVLEGRNEEINLKDKTKLTNVFIEHYV